jgi:hypothetical protein
MTCISSVENGVGQLKMVEVNYDLIIVAMVVSIIIHQLCHQYVLRWSTDGRQIANVFFGSRGCSLNQVLPAITIFGR